MTPYPAYLIEHAETRLDAEGRVHGPAHGAEPLDRHGRHQAVQLGARLRKLQPARIYTSPARRAEQTAHIAGAVAGIPASTSAALKSLDTGRLAGGDEREVAQRLKPYFDHPDRQIPGGETVNQWRARHLSFLQRVAKAHAARGDNPPAFVTHSNVVGSAIAATEGKGVDEARKAMANPPPAATPIKILIPAKEMR